MKMAVSDGYRKRKIKLQWYAGGRRRQQNIFITNATFAFSSTIGTLRFC